MPIQLSAACAAPAKANDKDTTTDHANACLRMRLPLVLCLGRSLIPRYYRLTPGIPHHLRMRDPWTRLGLGLAAVLSFDLRAEAKEPPAAFSIEERSFMAVPPYTEYGLRRSASTVESFASRRRLTSSSFAPIKASSFPFGPEKGPMSVARFLSGPPRSSAIGHSRRGEGGPPWRICWIANAAILRSPGSKSPTAARAIASFRPSPRATRTASNSGSRARPACPLGCARRGAPAYTWQRRSGRSHRWARSPPSCSSSRSTGTTSPRWRRSRSRSQTPRDNASRHRKTPRTSLGFETRSKRREPSAPATGR